MRYRLDLAYDGTHFCGWQIQPAGRTVQQVVAEALTRLLRQPITLTGSGRTDTGVHAHHQPTHFDLEEPLTDPDQLLYRLARLLPPDVKPTALCAVPADFHARFGAVARTYHYHVHQRPDPFQRFFSAFVGQPLAVDQMNAAAALLPGEHDFTTFSKTKGNVTNYRCRVSEAHWTADEATGRLLFTITANRFLRGQVRLLVGTLLDVGRNRLSVADFGAALAAEDRGRSSSAAPAEGLTLWRVTYPEVS
ncbi:MAG: tRNA pseudouridine(38-40) synthase TruA [Hymenobacteraceae bacterium]|nr:tRNA pseudouridine(38-40) synthase TruA [Hymenobacteraceae bacterium]